MKVMTGKVTSTKMNKTIIVEVTRSWQHPMYKKTVKRTKKFAVHDPNSTAKLGDVVEFTPSRPLSKTKHFVLVEKPEKK